MSKSNEEQDFPINGLCYICGKTCQKDVPLHWKCYLSSSKEMVKEQGNVNPGANVKELGGNGK